MTRKVTAVKGGSYRTTISVPGVTATVNPSVLNYASAGETRTVTITLAPDTAPASATVFGSLKFEGAGTLARLPIVVVPQAAAAPATVTGTG